MALEFSEPEFAGIIENNELVILDFWAEWCGPCKAYGPVFKRVSEDHPEVVFAKIDTNPSTPMKYGVRSIPTLLVFKNGEVVDKIVGAVPKTTLADKLNNQLG